MMKGQGKLFTRDEMRRCSATIRELVRARLVGFALRQQARVDRRARQQGRQAPPLQEKVE